MTAPKDGKLLWHLTCLDNIESIFEHGLLSRKELEDKNFVDVANHDILDKRARFGLEHYIPFHFFQKTPFAGDVMNKNIDKEFIYLTLHRDKASQNNFKIITKHPLNKDAEMYDYAEGIEKIEWELMEGYKDYNDKQVHDTCLAECVACYKGIAIGAFQAIYTSCEATKEHIEKLKKKYKVSLYVNVNEALFVKK